MYLVTAANVCEMADVLITIGSSKKAHRVLVTVLRIELILTASQARLIENGEQRARS